MDDSSPEQQPTSTRDVWSAIIFLLILVGLLAAVLAIILGVDTLLTRTDHLGLLAAQSLAVAVLVSAFFNLVPHYINTPRGQIANDGLGIIQSFMRSEKDYARQIDWSAEEPWGE